MLFDLDGTLTDPAAGITDSFRHALAEVGHPVDPSLDLTWIIGPPLRENFRIHGLPDHLHTRAVDVFRARHTDVGLFDAALVPGIVAVLESLRGDGVALGVATDKPAGQARTTLEHFGIAQHFDAVSGAAADGVHLSKAEIVADALRELGFDTARTAAGVEPRDGEPRNVEPPNVAMVGDRVHDIEGGRANRCVTVAVSWGYAQPGELDLAGPDHLVHSPEELLILLGALG